MNYEENSKDIHRNENEITEFIKIICSPFANRNSEMSSKDNMHIMSSNDKTTKKCVE